MIQCYLSLDISSLKVQHPFYLFYIFHALLLINFRFFSLILQEMIDFLLYFD
jgi:hypothetical protein